MGRGHWLRLNRAPASSHLQTSLHELVLAEYCSSQKGRGHWLRLSHAWRWHPRCWSMVNSDHAPRLMRSARGQCVGASLIDLSDGGRCLSRALLPESVPRCPWCGESTAALLNWIDIVQESKSSGGSWCSKSIYWPLRPYASVFSTCKD